jgi:putative acetyltransferase
MLRRAITSDAPELLRIRIAAIQALASSHYSHEEVQSWCLSRSAESYVEDIRHKVVMVEEQGKELVAFGQLNPSTAFIEAIYVHPSRSRQGIGRRLLNALEAVAKELGIQTLALEASLNAVQFYKQSGYVSPPVREHGYEGTENTVFMRRSLGYHTAP